MDEILRRKSYKWHLCKSSVLVNGDINLES